jgi:hypothetical protein
MKSEGQTIKYHRLSHVNEVRRRLGQLKEYDAQFYESANRLEKALYKRTPGRQLNDQHLDGMVIKQRTHAIAKARNTFDPDAEVRNKKSAYIVAAESGENTLVSTKIPMGLPRTLCLLLLTGWGVCQTGCSSGLPWLPTVVCDKMWTMLQCQPFTWPPPQC